MKNDFPDWAGFTPERAAVDLPRLLEEAEKKVAEIESPTSGEDAASPGYEAFVWKLDDATRGLWQYLLRLYCMAV